MNDKNPERIKAARKTSRQRISRKPVETKPAITLPLPSKDEIFDEIFRYCVDIQKTLFNKNYKIYTATSHNITLPRHFTQYYYKTNRSPQEFNAALESIKTELQYLGFKVVSLNPYLFRHEKMSTLYVYVKRYTHANTLGLYLMRYYNANTPTALDLL